MTGWMDIVTAPKSALYPPKVDLWVHEPDAGGYRVTDAFWCDGTWKITVQFGFRKLKCGLRIRAFAAWHTPTHWRKRPPPPEAA